jgi:amyloid beta precursor protein binding protein 1
MATDNKYDRQLRLWGPAGQKRLAESRILVLGAGPVASESLKNIVLPGCCATYLGGFATVVDDRTVTRADVGNNFFVTTADVGKPLAETVVSNLRELNDECDIRVEHRTPSVAAADAPLVLAHSLVISTTPLRREVAAALDALCRAHRIPCIFARAYGLLGEVRASYREHIVLHSKSLMVRTQLHALNPFDELKAYVAGLDLNTLPWEELVKLPSLTLCMVAAEALRQQAGAGGKPPKHQDVVAYLEQVFETRTDSFNADRHQQWEVCDVMYCSTRVRVRVWASRCKE